MKGSCDMPTGLRRLEWIDSWKGILIFLVVLGHVAGSLFHYTSPTTAKSQDYLYKLIYLFHMPAFFMVSGYLVGCSRKGNGHNDCAWNFFLKKAQRLLVPYLFWGVASIFVYLTCSQLLAASVSKTAGSYYTDKMFDVVWWRPFVSLLHAGGWPRGEGFRCNTVLWFLPCMFSTLFVHRFLRSVANTLVKVLVLMVICWGVGGAICIYNLGGWPWGLSSVPYYLGFVYLGQIISKHDFTLPMYAILSGIACYCQVAVFLPDMRCSRTEWSWYVISIFLAIVGCWLVMQLAKKIDSAVLQLLGVSSLGIMLGHKFVLLALQLKFAMLSDYCLGVILAVDLLVSVLATAVSLIVTLLLRRYAPILIGEWRK